MEGKEVGGGTGDDSREFLYGSNLEKRKQECKKENDTRYEENNKMESLKSCNNF